MNFLMNFYDCLKLTLIFLYYKMHGVPMIASYEVLYFAALLTGITTVKVKVCSIYCCSSSFASACYVSLNIVNLAVSTTTGMVIKLCI